MAFTLEDLVKKVRDFLPKLKPVENLKSWGELVKSPQLRQEYSSRVIQPKIQQFKQSSYGQLGQRLQPQSFVPKIAQQVPKFTPQLSSYLRARSPSQAIPRFQAQVQRLPEPSRAIKTLFPMTGVFKPVSSFLAKQMTSGPDLGELTKKLSSFRQLSPQEKKETTSMAMDFMPWVTGPTKVAQITPNLARSILKVKKGASQAEISSAYRNLIKKEAPRSVQDLATKYKTNSARLINNAKDILLKGFAPKAPTMLKAGESPKITIKPTTKASVMPVEGAVAPKAAIIPKELEPKIGDIVKLRSGRVDKITKVIPETSGDYARYMTQELYPPTGQKPKIGKLYYKPDSAGIRDFEIITQAKGIKEVKPEVKPIPKELEPLARKARKYKSAEEFVEAQPKVFHGSAFQFSHFKEAHRGRMTKAPSAKEATFFTTKREIAQGYAELGGGEQVIKLRERAEILENQARRTGDSKLFDKAIKLSNKADDIEIQNQRAGIFPKGQIVEASVQLKNPLVKDMGGKAFQEGGAIKAIQEAKQKGNDGVIFKNVADAVDTPIASKDIRPTEEISDVYAVFNQRQIKTKSQLTNFYAQTTEGIPKVKTEVKPIPKKLEPLSAESFAKFQRIKIEVSAKLRGTHGLYEARTNTIKIPKKLPTGFNRDEIIAHEIGHSIQAKLGQSDLDIFNKLVKSF